MDDIVGIINMDGKEIVSYQYDEWGNVIDISGDEEIAKINPFRYKSYYYDEESGFYYLNTRYYDPIVGRFINGDKYIDTNIGIHSGNMFAYCENSPVTRTNSTGEAWILVAGVMVFIALTATGCSSEDTSSTEKIISEPKYNTLFLWQPKYMGNYNCYGYAIGKTNIKGNPGIISGKIYERNLEVIVKNAVADLKALGYSTVKEISKSNIDKVKGTVICVRVGSGDYHWMKSRQTYWLHKPGNTAILKLIGYPYDYDIWYSDGYVGYWISTSDVYTSEIRYILYK